MANGFSNATNGKRRPFPGGVLFAGLPLETMRYALAPSAGFVDSTLMPVFLPSAPEMKLGTLWACQLVAAIRSYSLAPSGRLGISSTMLFLLPSRVWAQRRCILKLAACSFTVRMMAA